MHVTKDSFSQLSEVSRRMHSLAMAGGPRERKASPVGLACLAGCVLLAVAVVCWRGGDDPVALKQNEHYRGEIMKLEERSKEQALEAKIRRAASKLENDRAEKLQARAQAESTHAMAVEDKKVAMSDFAKARALASASVKSKAEAQRAEAKAQAISKTLDIKERVARLTEERAEVERKKATEADDEAESVHKKVEQLKDEIEHLQDLARAKSVEAGERVKVATKLLKTAKKLSVKAKAAQLKHLDEHKLPKDKLVSAEALKLMQNEARRVGKLLRADSQGLEHAEKKLRAMPAQGESN